MKKKSHDRSPRPPRISLGFRIALHYAGRMFRSVLPHLILFSVIYASLLVPPIVETILLLENNAISVIRDSASPIVTPNYDAQLFADDQAIYGALPDAAPEKTYRFGLDISERRLYFRIDRTITPSESESEAIIYTLAIVRDLSEPAMLLFQLLIALFVLDLIRVLEFLRSGKTIGGKLFKPIGEIAKTAQNLSGSNLSERINVEGTRNELRDLAAVINEMLDRIEDAYNSQKQFVSDASHELRTPIAVLQGYAEMLDRWGKSEPEVLAEAIGAILSETQNMKELVEKLLFLARHDKNTMSLEMDYFDMAELVSETAKETKLIAETHQVISGPMDSCIIQGDRTALKQALRAFVDNALKYTPAGGKVTLSCTASQPYCRVSISDTGIGISKEDMSRVFDRFYRATDVRASDAAGHGLGLSIARIIVVSHGGKIELQSKPGVGSRFHMDLPM